MPRTHLISISDDHMLGICAGEYPAEAVDSYYAGLDAYCEPSNELSDAFSVATLEAPAASVGAVEALLDKDETGNTLREIKKLVMTAHPPRWQVVDVVIADCRRSTLLRG